MVFNRVMKMIKKHTYNISNFKVVKNTAKTPNISINQLKLILRPKTYKSLNNFLTERIVLAREDGDFGVYIWDFEEWCEKYSRSWKNEVYEEDKKRR